MIPAGGALRGPTTTTVRVLWAMMATSAASLCLGIPAGGIIVQIKVKFRSPWINISNDSNAYYVNSGGDVNYNGVMYWNSCGMWYQRYIFTQKEMDISLSVR